MLELYFDRSTKTLQEFTIVMLAGTLEGALLKPIGYDPSAYYRCELVEPHEALFDRVSLCIQQSADQLVFYYSEASQDLTYYQVGSGFVLGIRPDGRLAAFVLTQLTTEALRILLGDVASGT